jgi:4-hydroxy-L-threonine phosphate dehydrogenase PdxA
VCSSRVRGAWGLRAFLPLLFVLFCSLCWGDAPCPDRWVVAEPSCWVGAEVTWLPMVLSADSVKLLAGRAPTYVVTLGDPEGIGPEVCARALLTPEIREALDAGTYRLLVCGPLEALWAQVTPDERRHLEALPGVHWVAVPEWTVGAVGRVRRPPGEVVWEMLEQAVALVATGVADGIVTGPIIKANLQAVGATYSGHTEIFEHHARRYFPHVDGPMRAEMLFVYRAMRVLTLTRHVPLRDVERLITPEALAETMAVVSGFAKRTGLLPFQVALLGVNPHAGEVGGVAERDVMVPFVAGYRSPVVQLTGPLPADAAFRGVSAECPPYHLYLSAYHNQGLIPMKLLGGFQCVNVTIGLPFIRTSVSHGAALDIVGQGVALPDSLVAAVAECHRLCGVMRLVGAEA